MTSHYYPSYCENASQYPFVGRVSVEEENCVDFIYQFVSDYNFDHIKDSAKTKCFSAHHICGTPTIFPEYISNLDLCPPNIFLYSSSNDYYPIISISPRQNTVSGNDIIHELVAKSVEKEFTNGVSFTYNELIEKFNNYIDIMFHEAVYPIRVSIYEVYNSGNIEHILAQDSNNKWFPLWNKQYSQTFSPNLFSPPLRSCTFKTKKLRLVFRYSLFPYRTAIDAVMLIGTSELILSKNPEENLTKVLRKINTQKLKKLRSTMFNMINNFIREDYYNLTADYKNAHLDIDHLQKNFSEYCIIYKRNRKKFHKINFGHGNLSQKVILDYVPPNKQNYLQCLLLKKYSNCKRAKRIKLSLNKSKKFPCRNFSELPNEIILKIFKSLNLPTLCKLNQVNRRFNNLTQDSHLYTRLNVRNIQNPTKTSNIFCYFTSRCIHLQQLDLTSSNFFISNFKKFLVHCGKHLKHLRLNNCKNVDNSALLKISKICKNLKELDLSEINILASGLLHLASLENLEYVRLNYINTEAKIEAICKILQKNQQMRELTLEDSEIDLEAVAIELRNSCRDLEIINLSRGCRITPQTTNALSDCKNLQRVYLSFHPKSYGMRYTDSVCRLFSSCQGLEEVYLHSISLTDHALELLAQCRNLKHLYLKEVELKNVSPEKFSCIILRQCVKLKKIYFSHSDYYFYYYYWFRQLKTEYPHVDIRFINIPRD